MTEKKTIRVVLLEPGKQAKVKEIDASISGMQKLVGGDIQAVYPYAEAVCLICNDEGKIAGLPLNRALYAEEDMEEIQRGEIYDIIAGTCFLCGCGGEDFSSLTKEQCQRYLAKFRWPEQFMRLGSKIVAIPMKSARDRER